MYELEAVDKKTRSRYFAEHSDLRRQKGPTSFSAASRVSILAWSEHCVECAIPHCYSTCDLYRARKDGKCRRFTFGIHPNPEVRSWLPYSVEVDFRVISHLWSKGNVQTIPLRSYRLLDGLHRGLGKLADGVSAVFGFVSPKRKINRGFYHYRKQLVSWLERRGGAKADGFLLQIINPQSETLSLRLVIARDPQPRDKPKFEAKFPLEPGYSEHWVPISSIDDLVPTDRPFEISLLLGNVEPTLLYILCADFVSGLSGPVTQKLGIQARAQSHKQGSNVKAVIWDLDNTLWDGILVESGSQPPKLRPGVADVIKALDQRGILQSVASKNNYTEAWAHLQALGVAEYFLAPQINWEPKGKNVRAIIKQLNIGADTVVLVDDQPFERGEVKAAVPEISTLPDTSIATLLADPRFQGSTSEEARSRRVMYQQENLRETAMAEYGDDYVEFLRSTKMVVDAHRPRREEYDRVHELIQRTNQLNFSGNRYTRDALAGLLEHEDLDAYALHCVDQFGDYGIVGFCVIKRTPTSARMIDLALSCRIQSKHVEHAFLLKLMARYRDQGIPRFEAEFRRTDRNTPAAQVFADLEFHEEPEVDGKEIYSRDLLHEVETRDYIDVRLGVTDSDVHSRPAERAS